MNGLLALSRGIDRVNTVIGRNVSWLILLAIFVSAINAVIRKAFSMSSNAWLELQWYLYGAAFLLAAAYTLQQNEHIRIDILFGALSRRVQHWIELLGHIFFLMPMVLLTLWLTWPWLARSYRTGEMSMNAGGLMLWPAKALLFNHILEDGAAAVINIDGERGRQMLDIATDRGLAVTTVGRAGTSTLT